MALLWHWAWLLILTTILAGGAAYLNAKRTTPVYQASTLVMVIEAPSTQNSDYTNILTNQYLAQSYAMVMTTQPVLDAVFEKLGLNQDTTEILKKMIQVEQVQNTQLMRISVMDTDPVQAAAIANTLVSVFSEQNLADQASRYETSKVNLQAQIDQMDQQIQAASTELNNLVVNLANQAKIDQLNLDLSQYRQTYAYLIQSYEQIRLAETQSISNIVQKEPATPPRRPIRPQTMRDTILAAFVGLMLGAGAIVLIEAMDDSIKGPEEITRQLGLPVLGFIASHRSVEKKLITISDPRSPVSEAFRSLRTNLQFASVDHPIKSILITSPSPEDGKSTVAGNLSVIMAQGGYQVLILDADLRKPMIHKFFRIPNRTGLSGLFTESMISLNGNLHKTDVTNLRALTSGNLPPNPSELLGSDKMTRILEQVYHQADFVIVDSPPVLLVTDSAVLAPKVDGVLLVVKPGVSKLQACKQAVEQLKMVGARILGVVLNDVDIKRSRYRYGYYKGYYSDKKGYAHDSDKSLTGQRKVKPTIIPPYTPGNESD
jgi:non-specific protein-tyrosine kinase